MKNTERKTENINGVDYVFEIVTEQNQQFIVGHIKPLNKEESFRQIENSSLILKQILYFHIYTKLEKYLIVKTANIEESTEYQAVFGVVDVDLTLKNNIFQELVILENNQEVILNIKVLNLFIECENLVASPFNSAKSILDTNSKAVVNFFRSIVFYVKIDGSTYSNQSFTEIIENAIRKINDEKFGKAFFLLELERLTCNPKEVQIKYAIMPNGI